MLARYLAVRPMVAAPSGGRSGDSPNSPFLSVNSSCRSFAANAVRLQLHALACNLGNFLRTLATPDGDVPRNVEKGGAALLALSL